MRSLSYHAISVFMDIRMLWINESALLRKIRNSTLEVMVAHSCLSAILFQNRND